MHLKTLNIIYDGQCSFCVRSLLIVRTLDLYGSLRFYDSRQPATFARFSSLRQVDVDAAMYAEVEGEELYSGFFAFRRLIWNSPLLWILIPVFYFPGASLYGPRVYTWVARNRNKLGCHSRVCDLPSKRRA